MGEGGVIKKIAHFQTRTSEQKKSRSIRKQFVVVVDQIIFVVIN